MNTKIQKTGTKSKAAEQVMQAAKGGAHNPEIVKAAKAAAPGRNGLISDARDAESAARMARLMMGFVEGESMPESTIGKACLHFEQLADALELAAGNIIQMLKTGRAGKAKVPRIQTANAETFNNFLHYALPDDSIDRAYASRIQGASYLVRMNTSAAAGLERLAAQHGITPERALELASLLIQDYDEEGCFKELLQEQKELALLPSLKFVEVAGHRR